MTVKEASGTSAIRKKQKTSYKECQGIILQKIRFVKYKHNKEKCKLILLFNVHSSAHVDKH